MRRCGASGLARDFELQLSGSSEAWQLTLIPHSLLLKQIFSSIRIDGGALVERIELHETQGDRTLMRMPQSQAGDALIEAPDRLQHVAETEPDPRLIG